MRKVLSYVSARVRGHEVKDEDGKKPSFWMMLVCDGLLLIGTVTILGGPIAIIVGAFLDFNWLVMGLGAGALLVGCGIFLIWKKLFWEPFARRLRFL